MVLAFTGPGMPTAGWQTQLSAWLQHISSVALNSLAWIPGWAVALVVLLGFTLLVRRALRTRATPVDRSSDPADWDDNMPLQAADTVQEDRREQDQR